MLDHDIADQDATVYCANELEPVNERSRLRNVTSNGIDGNSEKCNAQVDTRRASDGDVSNVTSELVKHNDTEREGSRREECDSDFDTGWAWVVLLASFGTSCIIGGALYTVGIIQAILLDLFHGNVSTTSLVGALHTSLISITGPVSSALIDRYSCRVAIVLSGCLYLIGYLGTAYAPNIEFAIITCGIIAGIAGGLAYTANMVIISFYFKKRRHLALGISSSGIGIGLFIFAPTLQYLRYSYGPHGVFILMAGIFFHIVLFGVICSPNKFEILTRQRRRLCAKKTNGSSIYAIIKSYYKTLSNRGIFVYCLATFNYCLGVYVLYMFYPEFIIQSGFTATEAANFISISGMCNVIGRVLTGVIANFPNVNVILVYSSSLGVVAIATCIYVLFSNYYFGQVLYFVVLGLFLGPSVVLQTSVSLKFVSVDTISQSIGLQLAFAGLGAIIGPVLAGIFVDNGGCYEHVVVAAAVFVFIGGLLSFSTVCFTETNTSIDDIKVQQS